MTPADLVSLRRSAAMLTEGAKMPVDRDDLIAMIEHLELRALLLRLGGDLTRGRPAGAVGVRAVRRDTAVTQEDGLQRETTGSDRKRNRR